MWALLCSSRLKLVVNMSVSCGPTDRTPSCGQTPCKEGWGPCAWAEEGTGAGGPLVVSIRIYTCLFSLCPGGTKEILLYSHEPCSKLCFACLIIQHGDLAIDQMSCILFNGFRVIPPRDVTCLFYWPLRDGH